MAHRTSPRRPWFPTLTALVCAVAIAACGSGNGKSESTSPATQQPATSDTTGIRTGATELGQGVTDDTIKLGVAMVNYDCIKDFVDFSRGDQQATYEVFVKDMNARGGVGGRDIVPVYQSYCPIGNEESLKVCTSMTEDEKVFAVIGVFIDFSGDSQLCLARDHQVVHIGHELSQAWIAEAPPGLLLTPDITAERRISVVMSLLDTAGTLQGQTVATLAESGRTDGRVKDVIVPALEELGVERGSDGVLTITGTDFTAALAQLDSFLEKWNAEGVDALVISGLTSVSKPFVTKIKEVMPDLLLITDGTNSAAEAGQDLVAAGTTPNPYEGMISADGPASQEQFDSPSFQACVKTYEEATGEAVVSPNDLEPGPDGKRAQIWIAVSDACGDLTMFKTIAEKVGADLNAENWAAVIDDFGPIKLVNAQYASLKRGKYDAADAFRLVEFDPTLGERGDWKGLTPIENVAPK